MTDSNTRPSDILDDVEPIKPSEQSTGGGGRGRGRGRGRGKGRGRGRGKHNPNDDQDEESNNEADQDEHCEVPPEDSPPAKASKAPKTDMANTSNKEKDGGATKKRARRKSDKSNAGMSSETPNKVAEEPGTNPAPKKRSRKNKQADSAKEVAEEPSTNPAKKKSRKSKQADSGEDKQETKKTSRKKKEPAGSGNAEEDTQEPITKPEPKRRTKKDKSGTTNACKAAMKDASDKSEEHKEHPRKSKAKKAEKASSSTDPNGSKCKPKRKAEEVEASEGTDPKAEVKKRRSRKASAYHKAKKEALKEGKTVEEATILAQEVLGINYCIFFLYVRYWDFKHVLANRRTCGFNIPFCSPGSLESKAYANTD